MPAPPQFPDVTPANVPEIVRRPQKGLQRPNSPAGDANHAVNETDGIGSHMDTAIGHRDAQSIHTDALKPANMMEIISTHQIESKLPDPLTMGASSHANETDRSSHHPGMLNMHMHVITPADEVGNISMHPIEVKLPDSPAGSTTSCSDATDGFGNHADRSSMHMDVQSGGNERGTAVNMPETIKMHPNISKTNNSPVEAASQCSDEPNGCRDHMDALSKWSDAHSFESDARTAVNMPDCVRMPPNNLTMQDSPYGHEKVTPKYIY